MVESLDSDLHLARQGDKEAYRRLIEATQDRLYGLVYSMVRNEQDAQDLIQEIYVKAYFALERFKGDASFFTWIYRIASNHCLDFLRRPHRGERSLDEVPEHEDAIPLAETLEAPSKDRPDVPLEIENEMSALLATLDPEPRVILVLRELEGHSYEEIASILHCPVNTVKSRLNRAREALKEAYIRAHGNIPGTETVQKRGDTHDPS